MGLKLGLDVKGRAQIEGVWERGAKKNVWTKEGDRRVEKIS
jgi:hypothetical protein